MRHDTSCAPVTDDCSWANFRAGFLDWLAESCSGSSSAAAAPRTSIWFTALAAGLLLFTLAAGAILFGPALATGMNLASTQVVAAASMALMAVTGLVFLVGLPLYAGARVRRFTREMCRRGWELRSGVRKPCRIY